MSLHILKSIIMQSQRNQASLFSLSAPVIQQHQQYDTAHEVKHHAKIANDWWNANGKLHALHSLNEIRVPFIRDGMVSRGLVDPKLVNTAGVLRNQHVLEVGCGGGILSEQLARLGATVTGIDLGEEVINVARQHVEEKSPELCARLTYKIVAVDIHAKDCLDKYDAVVLSEVIEHVSDKVALLTACVQALKPGGSIFITTINKTLPMWLSGVVLGENVLNLAPKGTHHWDKMISPLDVQRILDTMNCNTVLVNGSTYDFWRNTWRWINSTSMCYALQAIKTC